MSGVVVMAVVWPLAVLGVAALVAGVVCLVTRAKAGAERRATIERLRQVVAEERAFRNQPGMSWDDIIRKGHR